MSVIVDITLAEKLVSNMDSCCREIQKETKELLMLLNDMTDWKDNQAVIFKKYCTEIVKDLSVILKMEGNYLKMYDNKIKELR